MSRINTNVSSLIAQRVLQKNNNALNTSLERRSTGMKINRADNPAGLIVSEELRSEKAGIAQAIAHAERASNIIRTAEGGLTEISSLLREVQRLVSAAATSGGLSQEEVNANQLQVDSILSTINRIAQSTSFQGAKLLNGTYDYTTSSVASAAIDNLRITAARLPDGATEASIGIASVTAGSLGDSTNGYLSSLGSGGANSLTSDNLATAQKVIDKSIKQVSQLRGRLGAFQRFTIGSTLNSLGVALENTSAAESAIRDTDFAEETANLTRSQILAQAATTVLARANASPQAALALWQ